MANILSDYKKDITMITEDDKPSSKCPSVDSNTIDLIQDVESGVSSPTKEETIDENVVFWEGPDDPANPQNWSRKKKGVNIALLSFLTFLTPLASSMFAPGVPELMKEFGSDNTVLATFVVSVYILGWTLGPLIVGPMSELYGRLPVYNICNVGYICFTVACALAKDLNTLIALRFLQGCWSAAPITIGAGSMADMVRPQSRGAAMSLWSLGPLLGPTIGPIAGGFLSEAEGWRWIFWLLAIATAVAAVLTPILLSESYAPVLLERKAKKLRKETGNEMLRSKLDSGLGPKDLFYRAIVRPSKLLAFSPVCQLLSLYIAIVYGILYILFTTFTFVFEDTYGFSQSTVGLTYIGIGMGMLTGVIFFSLTADRTFRKLAARNNGEYKPEYRLPPFLVTAWTIPFGLFVYGWTAQYKVHWAVPIVATGFVGVGQFANFMALTTYLVDVFELYAASAVAAATVLRAVLGAVMPLLGLPMYNTLGLGWGNSILGFISLALCPIAYLFYVYGERIRKHRSSQIQL